MPVPRRLTTLQVLRRQAEGTDLVEVAAAARARELEAESLLYGDWRQVGAAGQPGFENGWQNHGGPFAGAGYFRDRWGFVHLRGVVKHPGVSTSTIFTLPAELRPASTVLIGSFSRVHDASLGVTVEALCDLRVETTGAVRAAEFAFVGDTGDRVDLLTLEGVMIRADNAGTPPRA